METIRLHPDDMQALAQMVARQIKTAQAEPERLYNLKELAEVLNIPYSTLSKRKLKPCKIGKNGRKMYRISDVLDAKR